MVEMGLVPFTPSKQYDISILEDMHFYPKKKSIMWRTEKTLRMGDQPSVTTMTERIVVKNVEDNLKQMASMGIASAYENSHNVNNPIEAIKQYKGKMVEMKDVMRKEEKVCIEAKRKYEATF